jgi:uncharacterized protein (DUF58 family)
MSAMIVLDASASMAFPEEGLSKFRYASIVAAALAYLIATQGDAIGLMTMANGRLSYLPARAGRPHLRSLIARLDRIEPGGAWDAERTISRGAELLKRRGVLIVISDFYDAEEATRREMRRVARRGHDVSMLQVTSAEERTFPYTGSLEVEDLESGARKLVDAAAVEARYRAAVRDFLERCRTLANRDGIDYALMSTDMAPERVLRDYLLRRGAAHRSAQAATRAPA